MFDFCLHFKSIAGTVLLTFKFYKSAMYLSNISSSHILLHNWSIHVLGIACIPSLHPNNAPATAALASASPPYDRSEK